MLWSAVTVVMCGLAFGQAASGGDGPPDPGLWVRAEWTRTDNDFLQMRQSVVNIVGGRKNTGSAPDLIQMANEAAVFALQTPGDAKLAYRAALLGLYATRYDINYTLELQGLVGKQPSGKGYRFQSSPLSRANMDASLEFARVRFMYEAFLSLGGREYGEIAKRLAGRLPDDSDVLSAAVVVLGKDEAPLTDLEYCLKLAQKVSDSSPKSARKRWLLAYTYLQLWQRTGNVENGRHALAEFEEVDATALGKDPLKAKAQIIAKFVREELARVPERGAKS